MTFDLFQTINGVGIPCPTDTLMATIDSQRIRDRVMAVRQAVAAGNKDEASRLKKRLPAVTWQAHFPDGKRRSEGALASGLYMLDVDGVDNVTETIEGIMLMAEQNGILDQIAAVHVSPSGRGIRVVAVCTDPLRDTIEKNQAWLAEQLGVVAYDAACKDFARLAYLVPYEDFRLLNLDLLSKEAPVTLHNALLSDEAATAEANAEKGMVRQFTDEQRQFCYHDMLISDIAQRYLDHFGRPVEGERNTYYYNMCNNFRYITDFNLGILLAQLPDLGLSMQERQKAVESSLKGRKAGRIPYTFWKFLEGLGLVKSRKSEAANMTEEALEQQVEAMEKNSEAFPRMPRVFREYCNAVPDEFKWPMTAALLPILGTLATRFRADYLDGRSHSTTFHSVIIAPASSGKSIFADAYRDLTEELRTRDAAAWEQERLYQEETRRKRNSKQLPPKPHVVLRLMQPSISVPKLLERQKDADGLHQLTFTPEVDTLAKTNKGKAGMDKNDMYRQAWDNELYGQDYMMVDTFSGQVRLYQNFLLTGTPKQVKGFYGDPENGLVSRVMFAHVKGQEFAEMPKFKSFDPKVQAGVDKALKILIDSCYVTNDKGVETICPVKDITVRMNFLYPALQQWLEDKRIAALEEADVAKDSFRKRAAVKAFRAAMVAVALYPNLSRRHTDNIRDWALWIADMDLQEHIDMYASSFATDEVKDEFTVGNMFAMLEDEFNGNDLQVLMKRLGRKSQPATVISGWKKAGMIIKVGKGMYRKTKKGKQKDEQH